MNSDAFRLTGNVYYDYCEYCDQERPHDEYWDSQDKKTYYICRSCGTVQSQS